MRILVIGGTRFIGRHLVIELLQRGHQVTILHRGRQNPFGDRVTEIIADRLDHRSVKRALAGLFFDAVFDNAYVWDRGTSARDVAAIVESVPSKLRRYVFTSSVAVYRLGCNLTEDASLADRADRYTRDKVESEQYLRREAQHRGLPVSIIRPPFVYGPHNHAYREAFFWDRIERGRPIILPDHGENLMHFAYVKDVAWALARTLEVDAAIGQAYNIAHESPVSQRTFVESLARVAQRPVRFAFLPRERIHQLGGRPLGEPLYFGEALDMSSFSVRIEKARRELGFRPTDWDVGLRETYQWYCRYARDQRPLDFSFEDRLLQEAEWEN